MMRHQIRLKKMTTATVNGRQIESVEASYNLYAELLKQGSSRSADNGQTQIVSSMRFRIFWRSAFPVDCQWRIEYDGRQYTVNGIDRDQERRFFYILTASANAKS